MIELGLGRISRLIRHTPQSWKAVHVAGTNGKGTICAYMSAMLHASGVRCGRFTSPHLIDRWDCIAINENSVRESVFIEAEELVMNRNKSEGIGASEFELLTATAFEVFAKEKIEMGVIEVGLGGRLDATNAMEHKAVTVISKIGLDHQSFLGNTIEEIAREKAGIMRPGVPCVLDKSNPASVRKVVEDYAREIGTDVILSSTESSFLDELSEKDFEPHQWQNLACAYTAFHLAYTKIESPLHRLLPAVQNINWPGRQQTIDIRSVTGRREIVLLDGAHNTQSAEALASYVDRRMRGDGRKVTWVLAASQGKEMDGILKPLLHQGDCVAAVQFGGVEGMPWVLPMPSQDILAASTAAGVDVLQQYDAGADISGALRWAVTTAAGGPIVIAGSLYLVSDVLRLLRDAGTMKNTLIDQL
jgi:folylpolyglutamate synthase/dihydrofolate synthase